MNPQQQEEINVCASKLIQLRDSSDPISYQKYLKFCIEKFKPLVAIRTNRYRRFSNYPDLQQDGFEALMLALKTYRPEKGTFTWWADKYISTRISRAANTHTAVRIPLKKTKEIKPFKLSIIPIMVDSSKNAIEILEDSEISDKLEQAIQGLTPEHQKVLKLVYGLQGIKPHSIDDTVKMLSIPRNQCVRILKETKNKLKEVLSGKD